MTEDSLDRLLMSLNDDNNNGQPASDLYKRLTLALDLNEFNLDYLRALANADLAKEPVKY
eukprot:CAMPEP_0116949720 /NCGR_PEP_ID=MMETSP0467-20121206/39047_1 /TAXON_ID=283647 /ORGANISM="Mesodinium pulex, Strain SPMC105" /LENGTH=59 /DNA_ID=CAMNT_0004634339 /DNA_START=13 /DNA_END=189 /DNA_ORIENTATION=-